MVAPHGGNLDGEMLRLGTALTPAERRVCDLVVREMSNRKVAQTLFVTEKTAELHLTSAYRKLGIRLRFQLSTIIPAALQSSESLT